MQQYKKLGILIGQNFWNIWQNLKLTGKHLYNNLGRISKPTDIRKPGYFQKSGGPITLPYPHEQLPVPERGRYKLQNEIDDCIVCDRCVSVCPVDCIEIEAIPSPTVIGQTSNGMNKRIYAAKFDIDMAKCCFCGLCTNVCPTACLTMTSEYDFSVFDFTEHKVGFATMSDQEIKTKKQEWEAHRSNQK